VLTLGVEPNDALTSYQAVVRAKTPDMNSANNSNVSSNDFVPTQVEPPIAAALPQDDETTPAFAGSISLYAWAFALLLLRTQRRVRIG